MAPAPRGPTRAFEHGEALHEACPGSIEPVWVPGAGHNDIETFPTYVQRISDFVESLRLATLADRRARAERRATRARVERQHADVERLHREVRIEARVERLSAAPLGRPLGSQLRGGATGALEGGPGRLRNRDVCHECRRRNR